MVDAHRFLVYTLALAGKAAADVGEHAMRHVMLTTEVTWPEAIGDRRGPFQFSKADLEQMAASMVRDRRIDLHHATHYGKTDPIATAAYGWLKTGTGAVEPYKHADGSDGWALSGVFDWCAEAFAWIQDKKFRYLSMEPGPGRALHGEKDTSIGWAILGGTLTNESIIDLPGLEQGSALAVFTPAAANAGGAHSESLTSTREPVAPHAHTKEAIMPERIKAIALSMNVNEDKIEEAITALATDRDTATAALATMTGERDALSAKVKEYEEAEATATKARFTAALATAREGGLPAGDDEIALSRWEMGEDIFADYVKANSTVKIDPKGGNRTDNRDANGGEALSRKEAGKKIEMLALAAKREDNSDFQTAYNKIEEMPEHKHLFDTYNNDTALYGDEDEV